MRTSISKPLIFVVISVLVVALIYSSYVSYVLAAPRHPNFGGPGQDCNTTQDEVSGAFGTICCWFEADPADPEQIELEYCQSCLEDDCGEVHRARTTPPTTGEGVLPQDGVFEQPPTPPPFDPTAPQQGGVLEQQEKPTPPPFAPGVSPGILEQLEQSEGAAPPFVPGFLERQQLQPPPADQGTGSEVPRTVEPLPPTCTPGSVFDPRINECVLENPPELCPDGSIPQSGGPGGTQPECPPSEAEERQAEEPEQPAAEEEEQQSPEEEDGSSEDNSNNN